MLSLRGTSAPRLQTIKWFSSKSKLFPHPQSCAVNKKKADITGQPNLSLTAVSVWVFDHSEKKHAFSEQEAENFEFDRSSTTDKSWVSLMVSIKS